MEVPKPDCYDSVPPCLCKKCQRFDMYMASCVPRTVGESTCGLAVVNAARSGYASVHSRSVRRRPAHSRPRSSVVAPPLTSSSVAPPVVSSPVAVSTVVSCSALFGSCARTSLVAAMSSSVCSSPVSTVVSSSVAPPVVSSPVAVSTVVSSSAPSGSRARVSTVAALSSSVTARPVVVPSSVAASAVSSSCSVVRRPISSGSLARPVSVSPVHPSPVVALPVKFGGVSSGPAGPGSTVPRFVRPRAPLSFGLSCGLPCGRPVGFPFIPVVCFVLAVPVLLLFPFGLLWSFLPVWR